MEDLNRTYAVLARIRRRKVRLRVRRPYSRNALAPVFYGRFSATSNGTLLRGGFRTLPGVVAFLFVWFGGLLLMGGWIVALNQGSVGFETVTLLLLIGSAAAFVWLFRRQGRADQEDILQMIRYTLKCRG